MRDTERTFVLAALVVFLLLAMHAMPKMSFGGTDLRSVNILGDLLPEPDGEMDDVIPAPKAPKMPTKVLTAEDSDEVDVMDHFYEALANVKTMDRPVRIAYFGDSFVENDIMTADLREMFQKDFGGNGVGWIDLANPSNRNARRTVTQQANGAKEYTSMAKPFDKQRQGLSLRYYTVAPGAKVVTNVASQFNRFQPHSKTFSVARLFFKTRGGARITAQVGANAAQSRYFGGSDQVQMYEQKQSGGSVTYTFNEVDGGFTGYGMALESNKGVILDCISMRGSSGLNLGDITLKTLQEFAKLRPYDLIIINYGLNIAVPGNSQATIKHYTTRMAKVISHLKQAYPEASFLVTSVPDHEQRSADGIKTLKEVKWLVSYQQQMAEDSHVAWLNLFQAMGGEGATKRLVDKKMANKDYTHLSYGGGRYVAKKVYPWFKKGLNNYKRRKKLE